MCDLQQTIRLDFGGDPEFLKEFLLLGITEIAHILLKKLLTNSYA